MCHTVSREIWWAFLLYLRLVVVTFGKGRAIIVESTRGSDTHAYNSTNRLLRGIDRRQQVQLAFPDFFLIGAGKCGTTSLHNLIVQHSELCTVEFKELHFFDNKWNRDGVNWYIRQFTNPKCKHKSGGYTIDSTPRYIRDIQTPSRLASSYSANDLKKKKFILLLREPFTREVSWYKHRLRECFHDVKSSILEGRDKLNKVTLRSADGHHRTVYRNRDVCTSPACASVGCNNIDYGILPGDLKRNYQRYFRSFDSYAHSGGVELSDGCYLDQIKRWLRFIRREQLFILNLKTLLLDTEGTVYKLKRFLGLKADWPKPVRLPFDNQINMTVTAKCATYEMLQEHYDNHNRGIARFINSKKAPFEPEFPPFENVGSRYCH